MSANETERYFQTLFDQQPTGSLIAVSRAARGWAADFYDTPQAAAAACAGGIDVFARVTPLRELPPVRENGTRGRGDADLSAALLALWVELDVKGTPDGKGGVKAKGFDSVEHALEVGSSVLEPTMAIGSGGGLHLYLVLAEPFVIAGPADLERAGELVERYQLAVKQAAGDVKIDSTHDLSRVLRPPGSFNGKGAEPRPVVAASNGRVELVEIGKLETDLPRPERGSPRKRGARTRRRIKVDQEAVDRALTEHPGLETLSARSGADPSADDYALACAAARDGLEPDVIEQLLAHRLIRHGDPKRKAERDDYVPRTVETAMAEDERERRAEQHGDPLLKASAIIGMEKIPIAAAEERRSGRVVLERADGLVLRVPSLAALAKYERLAAELAAGFGHELHVEKGKGTSTAVRFVAALRRHFGPGRIRTLEEVVEAWLVDLARAAGEVEFDDGKPAEKLAAWKDLEETDPADKAASAFAYATKIKLAHDTSTGDRYLRVSWAQEYLRRCGWRTGPEEAVDMLVAIGLEQPNSDGRVRARRRETDELVVLRFWIVPKALYERWTA